MFSWIDTAYKLIICNIVQVWVFYLYVRRLELQNAIAGEILELYVVKVNFYQTFSVLGTMC